MKKHWMLYLAIVLIGLGVGAIFLANRASSARDAASQAIIQAKEAIIEADKSKADTALAKDYLTSAKERFTQGKYPQAKSEAEMAKELAKKALLALSQPPSEEEPPPIFPEGVQTWRQVAQKMRSDPKYEQLVGKVSGMSLDQVELLAVMQESGTKLITDLPAGTRLTNTGKTEAGYEIFPGSKLKQPRQALTDQNGEPKVLMKCGNPIREVTIVTMIPPPPGPPQKPPVPPPPPTPPVKPPRNKFPETTPWHPENPFTPPDNQPALSAAIPGLVRDNAEEVSGEQAEATEEEAATKTEDPITGTNSSDFGAAGTGNDGAVTSVGSTLPNTATSDSEAEIGGTSATSNVKNDPVVSVETKTDTTDVGLP